MGVKLFPDDFKPKSDTLRIAVKRNVSENPKSPQLVGYVMLNREQAQALADQCPDNNETMFLRVAIWKARQPDAKYPLEGTISVDTYEATTAEPVEPPPKEKPTDSPWY